jgi:uncharacterized PurR-regulated membrane protein YhhQ (DUF165 family)
MLVWFILIVVIEMAFVLWSVYWRPTSLITVGSINLVLITSLGAILVDVFGFTSNVGNVFYTTVIVATYLLYELYGEKVFFSTVYRFVLSVSIFLILAFTVPELLCPGSVESICVSARDLFGKSPRIYAASISAFIVSLTAFMFMFRVSVTLPRLLQYLIVVTVVQSVDSIIFFTIAFSETHFGELGSLIFSGMVQKMLAHVAFLPVIAVSFKMGLRHDTSQQIAHVL